MVVVALLQTLQVRQSQEAAVVVVQDPVAALVVLVAVVWAVLQEVTAQPTPAVVAAALVSLLVPVPAVRA
jgi:hypothetical protein